MSNELPSNVGPTKWELHTIPEGHPLYRKPGEYVVKVPDGSWLYRWWVVYNMGWASSPNSINLILRIVAAPIVDGRIDRENSLYVAYPGQSGKWRPGYVFDLSWDGIQEWIGCDFMAREDRAVVWEKLRKIEEEQVQRLCRLIDAEVDKENAKQ